MSTRDFPPLSGHITYDPDTLMRWLNLVGQALNIDDHVAVTSPSASDEIDIFNIAAGKRRKVTLANIFAAITTLPAIAVTGLLDISGASAGQIKFPATQNASSNANTLDDYEEGTWTPIDSSGASLAFSVATGRYTKVGNLVTATGFIAYPATASGTLNSMGGLPFVVGNSEESCGGTLSWLVGTTANKFNPNKNTTTAFFFNSAGSQLTNANLSGAVVSIQATYHT